MSNGTPSVFAIVQARLSSTRLPAKVLRRLQGRPMLLHVLERLRNVRLTGIVVATTTNVADDSLVDLLSAERDVLVFRGSEFDVLARYHGAAVAVGADVVVRITSDCPLIDPEVSQRCIDEFFATGADYVSNCQQRTYPRGLDTEVFSFRALSVANLEASTQPEREHVTPYIWRHPERFALHNVAGAEDHSDLRLTVDTEEDFRLVEEIYRQLWHPDKSFSYQEVLGLFRGHPELRDINAGVQQKPVG